MSGRRTSGASRRSLRPQGFPLFSLQFYRVVADVWKKGAWEFQAKSGSSGSCRLFLHFLGKIAVQEMSGRKHLEVPDILLPDIRGLLILRKITVDRVPKKSGNTQ